MLRTDVVRLKQALAGKANWGPGYRVGDVTLTTGYFPVGPSSVLVVEAGKAFSRPRTDLQRSLWLGIGLSLLTALTLAFVAARWAASERKHAEALGKAARADVLSKMSAMAAHEIRNPLGVIRGTVELMKERMSGQLSEKNDRALTDILGEVERLRLLTEDFMDLAGDRPLSMGPLDLVQVARDAGASVAVRYPRVSFEVAPHSPLVVCADAGRVRQVFINLMVNAAQAQGEGVVRVSFEQNTDWAHAWIDDQGPGIPPALQDRLFDPFATHKDGGTGLGLALSRRLMERHGGTLNHVPKPSPGARFEIRLPLESKTHVSNPGR